MQNLQFLHSFFAGIWYLNISCVVGALLEKKTELDKRGMGISDYNNGLVNKPMGCRPSVISKESSSDRPPFLDKVCASHN